MVTTEEGDVITIPDERLPGGRGDFLDRARANPAGLLDLLALPLVLRDLVFLGHVDESTRCRGWPTAGLYAIVVYAVVVLGSLVVLFVRYDEVER